LLILSYAYRRTHRTYNVRVVKSMSIEMSLLVCVIAFVALVIAIIASLIYALQYMKQLTKSAADIERELLQISAQIKPLISHADTTVQTINDSMKGSVAIVKSSKHITRSVAN